MKAYLVDTDGENGAQIYFAETRGQAKALAANEDDVTIVDVISCRRQHHLDQYSPGPVPPNVLMEMGWWFECSGCSRRVSEDTEEYYGTEDGEPVEANTVIDGQRVWCTPECRDREMARREREKREHTEMEERARSVVAEKFPGAIVHDVVKRYHRDEPYAFFEIPGAPDHIGWELNSQFVDVAPRSRDAWDRFELSVMAVRSGTSKARETFSGDNVNGINR